MKFNSSFVNIVILLLLLIHQQKVLGQTEQNPSSQSLAAFEQSTSISYKFNHLISDKRSDTAREFQRRTNAKVLVTSPTMQKLSASERAVIAKSNASAESMFTDQSESGGFVFDGVNIDMHINSPNSTNSQHTYVSPERSFQKDGDVTFSYNRIDTHSLIAMPPLPLNIGGYKPIRASDSTNQGLSFILPWDTVGHPFGSKIDYTLVDGDPQVSKVTLGDVLHPFATIDYSGHKHIGQAWIPTKIVRTYWMLVSENTTEMTKSTQEEWNITDISTERTDIDDPLKSLTKGRLIQDDDGKTVVSFLYDSSKTIPEQHAIALAAQQAIENAPKIELSRRLMSSSSVMLVAGFVMLGYWTWKRAKSRQVGLTL